MENSPEQPSLSFSPGDRVQWDTVKGLKTGVIESKRADGYLIRLDNGKFIVAHETSLTKL